MTSPARQNEAVQFFNGLDQGGGIRKLGQYMQPAGLFRDGEIRNGESVPHTTSFIRRIRRFDTCWLFINDKTGHSVRLARGCRC